MKINRIIAFSLVCTLFAHGILYENQKISQAENISEEELIESMVFTDGVTTDAASASGYIRSGQDIYSTETPEQSLSVFSARTVIPSSYDSRDDFAVSPVENQNPYGTCWAFAATGAMESNILKKGLTDSIDLSSLHLAYSGYNKALDPLNLTEEDIWKPVTATNDIFSYGGNDDIAINTLSRWQGAVLESDAPYETIKNAENAGMAVELSDELMYQKDAYHLENAEHIYMSEPDTIKAKIMEMGGGSLAFHAPAGNTETARFANRNNTAVYVDPETFESEEMKTNHEALVVGWDDNYAVSNFNKNNRPESPGAWLVKNSYGTSYGDAGYFWLSYEDGSINTSTAKVTFYDVEPANNYDKNYQYDGMVYNATVKGSMDHMANIFTAQSKESLEAVSFWTCEKNVSYEISIYKVNDITNPVSGIKAGNSISGTVTEMGYHTIDFTNLGAADISLNKGEVFSVVIKLLNASGEPTAMMLETEVDSFSGMSASVGAGEHESFVGTGTRWYDCQTHYNRNLRIKAFTTVVSDDESEDIVVPSITPSPMPTVSPIPTVSPTPAVSPIPAVSPMPTVTPSQTPESQISSTAGTNESTIIVSKLKFSPGTKTVKVGKKINLSKHLKVTKKKKGTVTITYQFTKPKDKKYATLSKKGVLKAKKSGRKKTIYITAKAKDGSGKTAKIKIKIK